MHGLFAWTGLQVQCSLAVAWDASARLQVQTQTICTVQAAELHAVLQNNNKHVAGIHARDRAKCGWRRPRSGLSVSQIADPAASPTTIIRQQRPCTIQLHSVNLTTCMQTRFKFHGIGVARMRTARATPAGARSTGIQGRRCSNSAHSRTASSTALAPTAAA